MICALVFHVYAKSRISLDNLLLSFSQIIKQYCFLDSWKESVQIISLHYALVNCSHAPFPPPPPPPPPRGIAGTLTFVQQIPAKSPSLRRHPVGKTTALFHCCLLCCHCTAIFAYIIQIPSISSALQGQWNSKNTAPFHGYPPLSSGAVVTNDNALRKHAYALCSNFLRL